MTAWFNWENFFYLMGLIVAGGATFVAMKYKRIISELKEVFKSHDMDQKFCGVVKIPNARDMYGLYYDFTGARCFSEMFPENEREAFKKGQEPLKKKPSNKHRNPLNTL